MFTPLDPDAMVTDPKDVAVLRDRHSADARLFAFLCAIGVISIACTATPQTLGCVRTAANDTSSLASGNMCPAITPYYSTTRPMTVAPPPLQHISATPPPQQSVLVAGKYHPPQRPFANPCDYAKKQKKRQKCMTKVSKHSRKKVKVKT